MVWLYFIKIHKNLAAFPTTLELKPVHMYVLFQCLKHGSKLSVTSACLDLTFKEHTHC